MDLPVTNFIPSVVVKLASNLSTHEQGSIRRRREACELVVELKCDMSSLNQLREFKKISKHKYIKYAPYWFFKENNFQSNIEVTSKVYQTITKLRVSRENCRSIHNGHTRISHGVDTF